MRVFLPAKITKKIPQEVNNLFELFEKSGFELYLIGGGVRDLLLGRKAVNCDFTTNAKPEEIQKLLPDSFYNNVFGTVALIVKRGKKEEKYEITTYRGERGYTDHRRPNEVWWGKSLEEDLHRRESTINSIAIGKKNEKYELIDIFNGQEDLKNKIWKAVGNPNERYFEDALRMLRAIRFASQLGFIIEPATFAAIQKNSQLINQISKERVKEELFKILASSYPAEGVTLLMTSGLLQHIIPELLKGYGMTQKGHHIYDVWTHSVQSLKYCPSKNPTVRLATLIHDIGKPYVVRGEGEARTFYNHEMVSAKIAENLANRLKFSNAEKLKLIILVRWHQFTCDEHQTDSAIRRFIKNVGKENLQDMLDLRVGDRLGGGAKETSWRLEEFKKRLVEVQKQPFTTADLKVDGYDVMKILGLKPGPEVGQVLEKLFEEVIEGELKNQRKTLLEELKLSR